MTFKDDSNRDVTQTVSVAENSVIYHVTSGGLEAWILNDFDKVVFYLYSFYNDLCLIEL